ncbi:LapD/MoxY N-terminal periplasmic domain-containing protein [Hydrogenimonas sp.]
MSILLLLLLAGVLTVNFYKSKGYIEEQLDTNAKNTALALSLSLSVIEGDKKKLERVIDSIFERGFYELIELEDAQRLPVYRKTKSQESDTIPSWFKNWLPIETTLAEVLVSPDNRPMGVLLVKADKKIAYEQLYALFKYTVLVFLFFGIIGLVLLRLILKVVLNSLEEIRNQAEGILHNHFVIQKDLPTTPELREIAQVMNSMVKRVKEIYQRNSETMKKNQEALYRDPLTSLFNRRYFQIKMPEYLLANDSRSRGSLVLIRINGLKEANRKVGHKKVDEYLVEFAEILTKACSLVHEPAICRINGIEVVLVLPVFDAETSKELSRTILKNVLVLNDKFNLREIVFLSFGITEYQRKESMAKLMASADYALSDAALHNENHITVFKGEESHTVVLSKGQWRDLILSALQKEKFEPNLEPVYDLNKNEKAAYTLVFDIRQNGYNYSYGDYLPTIVELGMEHDLTMYELEYLKKHRFTQNALSIEIFAKTLHDSDKYLSFEESIKEIKKGMRGKLFIEISEYDILSLDPIVIEHISLSLQQHDIRFGINKFSGEKGGYGYLKYVAPAYVKMNENIYLDMDSGSQNALMTLLGSLDIKLILVGVHEKNFSRIKEEGVRYVMPAL